MEKKHSIAAAAAGRKGEVAKERSDDVKMECCQVEEESRFINVEDCELLGNELEMPNQEV